MPLALRYRIVAAILASSAALSACAGVPASTAQLQADSITANRVYVALNDDPTYLFRHIDVSVTDGVANLSGYVWSADAIYRARQIARSVPGVNRVVTSQLELERNGRNSGVSR